MITRLRNKIAREIRKRSRARAPYQAQLTFREKDSNWYEPILAGPSTIAPDCISADAARGVLSVLEKLTQDRYSSFNMEFYKSGLNRFGENWRHADILTVLCGISKNITIESYMEIGVRRGRSMSVVAALNPNARITGFDMWIPDYVGIENPGPDFVREELTKVGFAGEVEFISGNSHKTVPKYFKENSDAFFDVITVDGDHTARGAGLDLKNVIPRLKIGGVLVFDDIANPDHMYLKKVWEKIVVKSGRFMSYTFDEVGYGIAFALKKY